MKLYETIQDERLKKAVKKVLRDNGYKLHFIPATMTGRHHPIDERGYDGLMKHTEKVAWFLDQVCRQLNYSNEVRDILLTAAYFHDLGKIKQTKIIQEVKYSKGKIEREVKVIREVKNKDLHSIFSAELARKYLEKEGVEEETIEAITDIIKSHMSHWYPYLPQPQTELEKIFAIADFIVSRDEFQLKVPKESLWTRIKKRLFK